MEMITAYFKMKKVFFLGHAESVARKERDL